MGNSGSPTNRLRLLGPHNGWQADQKGIELSGDFQLSRPNFCEDPQNHKDALTRVVSFFQLRAFVNGI